MIYDVVIVGGGPAGLSAALVLGRSRRKVLVCDDGHYRNANSRVMHGFLTRDGIDPVELREIARNQLKKYQTVEIATIHIDEASKTDTGFRLQANDREMIARKVLLATGLMDSWPDLEGSKNLYGKSLFHCPYCDAFEIADQPLAIYGCGDDKTIELALELLLWSRDLIVCTDSLPGITQEGRKKLQVHHIPLYEQKMKRLISSEGILEDIEFMDGQKIKRRAIFFCTPTRQRSPLAVQLGCLFDKDGGVLSGKFESTTVPGLYVAGDASRDVLQAIVGAGEGAAAAVSINTALIKEDLAKRIDKSA